MRKEIDEKMLVKKRLMLILAVAVLMVMTMVTGPHSLYQSQ